MKSRAMVALSSRRLARSARRLSSSPAVFSVTAAEFQSRVVGNAVPVVLDCYADWCGPCKTLTPLLKSAVEAQRGSVQLALLDTDAEQELGMQLGIRSLPTVYGVAGGRVVDTFTGARPKEDVDRFVANLAKHGPPPPQEEEAPRREIDDAATSLESLSAELAAIRRAAEEAVGKRRLSKEFDEKAPEAKTAAELLEAIARCHLELEDFQAARAALAELKDPKRAAVIDKHAALKQAVAHLALALADDHADLRDLFSSGRTEAAVDMALERVKLATKDDDRDKARRILLDFIEALGPGPLATSARKRLANALFR